MGTVRPDVSGFISGIPFAIEVQISALTMEQIVYRTREYAKKGIYVLWLALHKAARRKPIQSESVGRWVHAAYFGRVLLLGPNRRLSWESLVVPELRQACMS